jgi:hypothetical protein
MARGPKNRGGNSKKKAQLKNKVCPESVETGGRLPIPSTAIDTIGTYAAIIVGALTGIVQALGHTSLALWLLFLTIWLAALALAAHAYEKHWPPWKLWGHPRWIVAISGGALLICAWAIVNLRGSEAPASKRPMLTVYEIDSEIVPMAFKIAQAEVTLYNSGEAPAIVRHFAMGRVEFSRGDDLDTDFRRIWKAAREDRRETPIAAGGGHRFHNNNRFDFVSDESLSDFHSGIIKIFYIGACEYTGIDGGDYALEWCYEFDFVTQSWLQHKDHNRIDVPPEERGR